MHLDQNNVEHTKPSSEQLHGLTDAEVRQHIEPVSYTHLADSIPKKEYEETQKKALAVINAIKDASQI